MNAKRFALLLGVSASVLGGILAALMSTDAGRQALRVVRYEWWAGQPIVWSVPRQLVACTDPKPDFVALSFGQSNAANSVQGRHQAGAAVSWFHAGRCYAAEDPLPGPDGTGGSVWSRLGDRLIASGRYRRVMFAGIAAGGSELARWQPGGDLHPRLMTALATMRAAGVPPTHLLWHQGERDMQLKTDAATYGAGIRKLVSSIREAGSAAPVFVAQATYCGGRDDAALRAAQRDVVNPRLGIFAGPDTDILRGAVLRHDDCHFSAAGAVRHAALWQDALLSANH